MCVLRCFVVGFWSVVIVTVCLPLVLNEFAYQSALLGASLDEGEERREEGREEKRREEKCSQGKERRAEERKVLTVFLFHVPYILKKKGWRGGFRG